MEQHKGKYIGTVEDNQDPKKLGRLKVRVPALYGDENGIPTEALPWADPNFNFSSENQGIFFVPDIGSLVGIDLQNGSVYNPVWSGGIYREKENMIPEEANDNYPEVRIIRTKIGYVKMDDKVGVIEIKHKCGSYLTFTNEGDIIIHAKRDIIPMADRNFIGMPEGNESVTAIPDYKSKKEQEQMTEEQQEQYKQEVVNYRTSYNGNCGKNGIDIYNESSIPNDSIDTVVANEINKQSKVVVGNVADITNKIGKLNNLSDVIGFLPDDMKKATQMIADSMGVNDIPTMSSFDAMQMIANGKNIELR